MNKNELAFKLTKVIAKIEELRKLEQDLRSKLLELMHNNETVQVNGYNVTKKVIKETIIDPVMLQKFGFDLNRVTVTITKIDPKLVRVIGEAEKKVYYTEKPVIIVAKSK